jgi:hypothetical protein
MRAMSTFRSRLLAALSLAGIAATSLSACQVQPGDYRVFRITQLPPAYGADCPDQIVPDARDTTTFFNASTVAMFAVDADSYFIEFGGDGAMTGTRDGSSYNFAGETVNVEDVNDTTSTTTQNSTAVSLTIKGKEISGDFTYVTTFTCDGNCMGIDNTTCTVSGKFFGSEINGVELEYPVGGGAAQP